jgi:hypothetical protein
MIAALNGLMSRNCIALHEVTDTWPRCSGPFNSVALLRCCPAAHRKRWVPPMASRIPNAERWFRIRHCWPRGVLTKKMGRAGRDQ